MTGKIHSFQSLGTLDGPGVRTVIFMHGCNLHCGYCHNVDVCRGEYGEYSSEDVFEKIEKFKEYFGDKGGVTVSGGEPLLQAEFVLELFKKCQKNNINTALDTSASIMNDNIKQLLEYTDLVLLDIKMTDDEDYKKYIGCSLSEPVNFLEYLNSINKRVWIRYVVVEGLNDNDENIKDLKNLCKRFKNIEKIELLPFKKICKTKYESMKIEFEFDKYPETSKATIERLYKILKAEG